MYSSRLGVRRQEKGKKERRKPQYYVDMRGPMIGGEMRAAERLT